MTQQLYNLGGHHYLVEVYDAFYDLKKNPRQRKFVMLRNFTLSNDIINDTDIYIIESNTFKEFIKDIHQDEGVGHALQATSKLAFPIPGSSITSYSDLYSSFNNDLKDYSLFENYDEDTDEFEYGSDVYRLMDQYGNDKPINCDLIRIYHPTTEKSLNALIYVDCYMNGIHFHLLCQPYSNYSTSSSTEIRKYNNIYSEYVELLFPNISDLFGFDNSANVENFNVYYEENINTVISSKNDSFIKKISIEVNGKKKTYSIPEEYDSSNVERYMSIDADKQLVQRVPLNLLIQPYKIVEEKDTFTNENHNVKLYLKQFKSIENNYLTYPFNVTIFPYSYVDSSIHTYVMASDKTTVTNTFFKRYSFSIYAEPGFNNGTFSIITTFDYPRKDDWIMNDPNHDSQNALKSAYEFYYNVKEEDYKYFWVYRLRAEMPEEEALLLDEVDSNWDEQYDNNSLFTSDKNGNRFKWKRLISDQDGEEYYEDKDEVSDEEKLARIIESNFNGIKDELKDWEIEDEYNTSMDFMGYRIRISSDPFFKNIIYDTTITSELSTIDDFSFAIDNIFNSWDEVPDLVVCVTEFIDRITGNVLNSNVITLNKELIKYMVVKDFPKIWQLSSINDNMREIQLNNIESIEKRLNSEMSKDIGKLKKICKEKIDDEIIGNEIEQILMSMKDKYDEYIESFNIKPFNFIDTLNFVTTSYNDSVDNAIGDRGKSIVFKPIFYKTFDLQNIQLRSGVTQNIGINLNQYLTKVSTFKLKINDIDFIETSRNDMYVIFKINSNLIIGGSGTYNIVNQDDEYISSGQWIMY